MTLDREALNVLKTNSETVRTNKQGTLRMLMKLLILVAIVATVLIMLFLWKNHAQQLPTQAEKSDTNEQVNVKQLNESIILNASGYITATNVANVASIVTARVSEIFVQEGMQVSIGETIAKLDSKITEAEVNLAKSELEVARQKVNEIAVQLESEKRVFYRIKKLGAQSSLNILDKAKSAVNTLEEKLTTAKKQVIVSDRKLALRSQKLKNLEIKSPINGIVTAINVKLGDVVSPFSNTDAIAGGVIATIVDKESLEVEVEISEIYIKSIKINQKVIVTLDAYPNLSIPSYVKFISPIVNRQKATVKVRVGLSHVNSKILPDMSVQASFLKNTEIEDASNRKIAIPAN